MVLYMQTMGRLLVELELKNEQKKLVDAILDTSRLELARFLAGGRAKYLSELAKEAKMDRATLAYHLDIMERVGLVDSEYKILQEPKSKGRAARYYTLNMKKWNEAVEIALKLLPEKK
jgi:DNA-binding transcriptional ArsR family regulator